MRLDSAHGRASILDSFLSKLPRRLRYAVEVRHRAFFSDGPEEHDLDSLLRAREVDFFAHHANDTLSPGVARMFHEEMVALRPDLGRLPEWPCERERAGVDLDDPSGQMTLFG